MPIGLLDEDRSSLQQLARANDKTSGLTVTLTLLPTRTSSAPLSISDSEPEGGLTALDHTSVASLNPGSESRNLLRRLSEISIHCVAHLLALATS